LRARATRDHCPADWSLSPFLTLSTGLTAIVDTIFLVSSYSAAACVNSMEAFFGRSKTQWNSSMARLATFLRSLRSACRTIRAQSRDRVFFRERTLFISTPFQSEGEWKLLIGDERSLHVRTFSTFLDAKGEFEAVKVSAALGVGFVDRYVEIEAKGEGAQAQDIIISMWRLKSSSDLCK